MKKYIFFDLDNTITRSRSTITKEMSVLLGKLTSSHEVIIVSGADAEQIEAQIGKSLAKKCWTMGQNGNKCTNKKGKVLWENRINWLQKHEVLNYCHTLYTNSDHKKNVAD